MKTSKNDITKRQLTLRLPLPLVKRVKLIAKRRKTTVNSLLVSLVTECDREERERVLRQAYETIGRDDVDFALEAQREVVERE